MIESVKTLHFHCECGVRADVEVIRTNDELGDDYIQWGKRALYYCREHIPDDVREFWGSATYDFEKNSASIVGAQL